MRTGRFSETGRPYLITTVTHNRTRLFDHFTSARLLITELRRLHDDAVVDSLAWVVMPDHLHWLIVLDTTPLADIVRLLKGRSARKLNILSGKQAAVWQKGFHDHALRKEEDVHGVARYIIANPLRAGLVTTVADYPHWDAVWV